MIKVDDSNIKQTKMFILENLKRSGFTYGNLMNPQAVSYIKYNDQKQIIAMTNVLDNKYCTYLFPLHTAKSVVREVLDYMQGINHIGGTVTGDYFEIFSEYYQLPDNAVNEVATLNLTEEYKADCSEVVELTQEDVESYKRNIDKIKEFPSRSSESITQAFERSYVVGIKVDGEVVSSATLTAISDKTAVVVSVFTVPNYTGKGYASKCVSKLLKQYGNGRTTLIFFSNPVAKQIYLNLGFEVDDTLIMYDQKLK